MGVREPGGKEDFALEPIDTQVGARPRGQDLDRYAPPELHVAAEVHGRHAALAQLAHQRVAAREGAGQAVEQGVGGHHSAEVGITTPPSLESANRARSAPRSCSLKEPIRVRQALGRNALAVGDAPHNDEGVEKQEPRDALAPRVSRM